MPKVFLNSGRSSPQGLPAKMRLNISSNSRRTPNKSSNNLSVVYRFFISSSSNQVSPPKAALHKDSRQRRIPKHFPAGLAGASWTADASVVDFESAAVSE